MCEIGVRVCKRGLDRMSGRGGGGMNGKGSNNNGGVSAIPAASRKMVQSLKEIVNCPEHEIYAMLKECNMDPNDAVHRLLSQDPFREVKSKREKKKENKDTSESRPRGASSTANRGGRGGRSGPAHSTSTEYGVSHRPAYKKENGPSSHTSSSPASVLTGNSIHRRTLPLSDSLLTEQKISTIGTGDVISSSSQTSSGFPPAWSGAPGQLSMADIVRMGRPKPQNVNNHHHSYHYDHHSSQDHSTKLSEVPSAAEEWPVMEPLSVVNVSSILESQSEGSEPFDRTNQHPKSSPADACVPENGDSENFNENHVEPDTYDHGSYNMSSYQPHQHDIEHQEVEEVDVSVSSVSANLEQLNLQKDEEVAANEQDNHNPSVVIPDHLQVQSADCSHLSFGSFGSGISAAFSAPFSSSALQSSIEQASDVAVSSSVGNTETRNPEYYGDEHLRIASDGNLTHRSGASVVNFEPPSASQPEVSKQEAPESAQYTFASTAPDYNSYEDNQQLNASFSNTQTSSQMQNLAPFSSVMQAYTNSLPSALLGTMVQPGRDSELPYSPFPVAQPTHTKYGNTVASVGGSTIPIPEGLKSGGFSTSQQTNPLVQPNANIASGPALPQHLVHPYSQPTLPLGHFANMISYPFMPQSYTYMPSSVFQQAFPNNSSYHQSLAAVLPQYKNSVSVSSLPQSASVASGYGSFGSSNNFPLNPPAAPAVPTMSYDDVLSSQYKDGNHLVSLPQNDNSAMWVHGPGSRTMSALPASQYYSIQGQNQQSGGYRQGQQPSPSQHYGALGYPNFYHTQTGISLEQQNPRDGSLGGSQGQPPKQSQQIWQNSY